MYTAADFSRALEDYIQFNRKLMEGVTPMSRIIGVLGFGKKPGNDPGHEEFFNEMKSAIDKVCESQPDSRTADDIMDVIFKAKVRYADEDLSPFTFTAIESQTQNLIPFLSDEKAKQIYDELKHTPIKERTPVRKQLMAALESRAGV